MIIPVPDASFTVAGIDIGGPRKGCHLVMLRGNEIVCNANSRSATELAKLCNDFSATVIGIDSPCRWGHPQSGRLAEKALARERIFCFATPTRERAIANASGFYGWMFCGEAVYQALSATHPLLTEPPYISGRRCFETFPHAITCALLGSDIASAKLKGAQRRALLEAAGIDTGPLTSIDAVDAALCALTAGYLREGNTKAYGNTEGGHIFVPAFSGTR